MPKRKKLVAGTEKIRFVQEHELPLSCPTSEMLLWNAHPKVYMPLEKTLQAVCPYCSTRFILQKDAHNS